MLGWSLVGFQADKSGKDYLLRASKRSHAVGISLCTLHFNSADAKLRVAVTPSITSSNAAMERSHENTQLTALLKK